MLALQRSHLGHDCMRVRSIIPGLAPLPGFSRECRKAPRDRWLPAGDHEVRGGELPGLAPGRKILADGGAAVPGFAARKAPSRCQPPWSACRLAAVAAVVAPVVAAGQCQTHACAC